MRISTRVYRPVIGGVAAALLAACGDGNLPGATADPEGAGARAQFVQESRLVPLFDVADALGRAPAGALYCHSTERPGRLTTRTVRATLPDGSRVEVHLFLSTAPAKRNVVEVTRWAAPGRSVSVWAHSERDAIKVLEGKEQPSASSLPAGGPLHQRVEAVAAAALRLPCRVIE